MVFWLSYLLFLVLFIIGSATAFLITAPLNKNHDRGLQSYLPPSVIGHIKNSRWVIRTMPKASHSYCMVKFNGEKWVAETPNETAAAGYPLFNTLFLHGPLPFFTRVFQPDDYEQAILKFMANDKCDRKTAQGNMDMYLSNPNDWAFNRLEEKKKGVKYDYVTLDPQDVVLVLAWTVVLALFFGRGIYAYIYQVPYNDFMNYL